MAQNKRFEENKRKAQIIQKKLLALAEHHQMDAVEDQQPENNGTRREEESTPSSDGNTVEGNMINLGCNADEIEEPSQNANLTARSQKEKEAYKTQCRPACSKIHKEPHEGVTGRKSKGAKITEVDLVSDSDEEK